MSNPTAAASAQAKNLVGTPTNVSEPAFEFLLSSMLHWVEHQCHLEHSKSQSKAKQKQKAQQSTVTEKEVEKRKTKDENAEETQSQTETETETETVIETSQSQSDTVMVAEHTAAKMERLGYDVGYRLSERLAQSKSLIPPATGDNSEHPTPAAVQLEAVKFICKEFWMEVYHKQIDKLQTNHRGVFVLKDMEFKWLKRLPGDQDLARVMAIKILAFPCGLIRGAMANLGIVAVVSCDFLADGRNMSSCSFNIKIKSS